MNVAEKLVARVNVVADIIDAVENERLAGAQDGTGNRLAVEIERCSVVGVPSDVDEPHSRQAIGKYSESHPARSE